MYKNIFINSNGSNIYASLGFLDRLKENTKHTTIWNVSGDASLILFFKILGFTASQTFEKLKSLEIINTFINGHSLFPENEEEKIDYLKNFLSNNIKNSILKEDCDLKTVEKLTGITPCFIVWNRTKKSVENLNSRENPDLKLLDVTLACLANIGVFKEYTINKTIYSSLENIEPIPVNYTYSDDNKDFLYVINISQYIKEYCLDNNLGPLSVNEDEFLLQKGELINFRAKEILPTLTRKENIAKVYSIYSRGISKEEEKSSLFILGYKQATGFLENVDTFKVYNQYLDSVYRQL